MKPLPATLALLLALLRVCHAAESDEPRQADTSVTVAKVAVNAMRHVGKKVRWTGTVREILSAGIPLKVMLKTGEIQWVVHFWDTDTLPETLFVPGTVIIVEATVMPPEAKTVGGTGYKFVTVWAHGAGKAGRQKAGKPEKQPARPEKPEPDDEIGAEQ